MANQGPDTPQGLGKSRFGRDPEPDYDNEDVRKQELERLQIKAYHSVMKAFSEEFSFVSTMSSSKKRDIVEKLIKELNISQDTQISVKNKIQEEIHGVPQRGDSSLTTSATPSTATAPASGSSATDVPASSSSATTVTASGSSATTVTASGSTATAVPDSSLSSTTIPASGSSPAPTTAPASGSSATDVPAPGSSATDVPAPGSTAIGVPASGSSATDVPAPGSTATGVPASGSSAEINK